MPLIEIYFSGLICHFGPDVAEGSDRTTLVKTVLLDDGDYHVAKIRTSLDAADSGLGRRLNSDVRFTNLGSVAKAQSLFSDTVPHLDDLTRAETVGYSNPPGYAVYLPDGPFTVAQFYKLGAQWTIDGDTYIRPCVPRTTILIARGGNVSVQFNNDSVKFDRNGWILITNLETGQKPLDYQKGDDWRKQSRATTGDVDDIACYYELPPPANNSSTCQYKTPYVGQFTSEVLAILGALPLTDSSECTNSHWP
jgi:hypothetical protein